MIIWPWIGHGCPMFKLKSKNLSVSADLLGKLRISYMFLSKLPNSYAIFMQKRCTFSGEQREPRQRMRCVIYKNLLFDRVTPFTNMVSWPWPVKIPGTTKSFKHSWMLIPSFNPLKIKQPTRKKNTPTCNPGKFEPCPNLKLETGLFQGVGSRMLSIIYRYKLHSSTMWCTPVMLLVYKSL